MGDKKEDAGPSKADKETEEGKEVKTDKAEPGTKGLVEGDFDDADDDDFNGHVVNKPANRESYGVGEGEADDDDDDDDDEDFNEDDDDDDDDDDEDEEEAAPARRSKRKRPGDDDEEEEAQDDDDDDDDEDDD